MIVNSSYSIKLRNINKVLKPTIITYRNALKFILDLNKDDCSTGACPIR